jgi:hypothetical protein
MYLHLGGDRTIFIKDIVGIFDLEGTTINKETRAFLKVCEEEGFIQSISNEMPRSFIITEQNSKSIVYLSPISVQTLRKRIKKYKEKGIMYA